METRDVVSMDEEYNNFLLKVEDVNSIINDMKSKDPSVANKATQRADFLLGNVTEKNISDVEELRVKINKTVINKKAFENESEQKDTMAPEAFMAYVEKDAEKRAADRRERKEIADSYKRRANNAFRTKDYEKALDFYNKAIEQVRDSCVLYTNRALTCLNLHLYSRVISDCEWAHKLNENSLKAWLYKARAYHEMGDAMKSAECVREAELRNPKCKAYIEEYCSLWESQHDHQ